MNGPLQRCEDEPIRIPGSIQPHGFLLALDPGHVVVQASANLIDHLGVTVESALGRPLAAVAGPEAARWLTEEARHPVAHQRPVYLGTMESPGGRYYDMLAHHHDGLLVCEFEPSSRDGAATFRHMYPLLGDFLNLLTDVNTVVEMCQIAADEIRNLTAFGRVMVYRFNEEGHGEVLAESRDAAYPSYLGQRFPAADIPPQARALYVQNRVRLIHDANYTPAPLAPVNNPLTGQPTDLGFAALRSVSPVHLQYMRNMGTYASMSVSLVVDGRLWGLVSCHHEHPCHVAFGKRSACEQLGQLLALRIASRETADELNFRLDVRRIMVSVLARLTKGVDFIDNLAGVFPELLQFARASGVAVLFNGRIASFGACPDDPALRDLVAWLASIDHGEIFHTDALHQHYQGAAAIQAQASGLLALPISRVHQHYLLWFRAEQVSTIEWAGNPNTKNEPGKLSPRASFDSWKETVHGRSMPWHPGELELALEFRTALLGIALERAEQMAELAEELGRANKELEAFSYSVSHDLRAPLRHIVGFSDLLLEANVADPQRQRRFLTNIKDSARLAGKLVDDLLSFSQMGRAALRPVQVDMVGLVQACIEKVMLDAPGREVEWEVAALPSIYADPVFLRLALLNLLANAVKFTATRESAKIRITFEENESETIFHVADNGVGFSMEYVHKLFGVFQRLHRMEDFQGTGIGLANVRRIVERHGGRVWAEGTLDQGATFSFAIPKVLIP